MNPTLIAIVAFGFSLMLLVLWILILERRIKKLMGGSTGASLEDTINQNQTSTEKLFKLQQETMNELARIDERMKKKIHGAKTLRFNPFAGTGSGGNQSFATALLDENGDGVVISSLYSREKLSVFAKPIIGKKSEFELTEEEKEVLKN